eukprot:SAG31_NODE_920_length_10987_cov_4.682757_9_plen_128_part_00
MIAFSLIPGACGLAASSTLQLKRRPLLRDVMTYSISLMLLVIFIWDGCVSLAEASFLFGLYPCYLVMLALAPKFRAKHKEKVANRPEALFTRFMDDSVGAKQIYIQAAKSCLNIGQPQAATLLGFVD